MLRKPINDPTKTILILMLLYQAKSQIADNIYSIPTETSYPYKTIGSSPALFSTGLIYKGSVIRMLTETRFTYPLFIHLLNLDLPDHFKSTELQSLRMNNQLLLTYLLKVVISINQLQDKLFSKKIFKNLLLLTPLLCETKKSIFFR